MRFPVDQPCQITTLFSAAHPGIDIAPLPAGTTGRICHAPEQSTVMASSFRAQLEGNYVILKGASGHFYYFGHFAQRLVSLNQTIPEGAEIGIIGQTGSATGIHTHHEVRPTFNPVNQIDPEQYYATNAKEISMADENFVKGIFKNYWGVVATDQDIKDWIGTDCLAMEKAFRDDPRNLAWKSKIENALAGPPDAKVLSAGLYKVN